jgi:hypothetical protein
MNKSKKVLLMTLLMTLVLFSNIKTTKAVSYQTFTNKPSLEWNNAVGFDGGIDGDIVCHQHISGKMITVCNYVDEGGLGDCRIFNIMVFGIDGTLLSDSNYTFGNFYWNSWSIYDIDSDNILIPLVDGRQGRFELRKFNLNTFTISTITSGWDEPPNPFDDNDGKTAVSKDYIYYDDKMYFIFIDGKINILEYDDDTETLTVMEQSDITDGGANVFLFGDNNNTSNMYFMATGTTTPTYYRYDINTDTLYTLCNHPYGDRINPTMGGTKFLGGDIEYNGSNIYLWWNWLSPKVSATNVRSIKAIQHRLLFNQTVNSTMLTSQNERYGLISPILQDDTDECWTSGYMFNRTRMVVYYPRYEGDDSWGVQKDVLDINNFYNFGTGAFDNRETIETTDIPTIDDENSIGRDYSTQWLLLSDNEDNTWRVYYGYQAQKVEYDITLSYNPTDSPLIVDKSYTFTMTLTGNDIPVKKVVGVYLDDNQQIVSSTTLSGTKTFTLISGTAGYRTLSFKVFDNDGIEQYEESFTYQWDTSDISDVSH